MTGILLACDDARVDVDHVPSLDGLTLATADGADGVVVLGAPRALFEAIAALRDVVRGSIAVAGAAPRAAVRDRRIAAAPLDPPLPARWLPLEYLTWSARLAGLGKAEANASAKDAVERLKLGASLKTAIGRLVPHARRALTVGAALATGARVLALEDPLAALPDEIAASYGAILVAALEGKSWIALAARAQMTSPLTLAASEVVVVSRSRVEAQGAPADVARASRRFALRVELTREAGEAGAAGAAGAADAIAALVASLAARGVTADDDNGRLVVDLGDRLSTAELLGLCDGAGLAVIELHAVARALA